MYHEDNEVQKLSLLLVIFHPVQIKDVFYLKLCAALQMTSRHSKQKWLLNSIFLRLKKYKEENRFHFIFCRIRGKDRMEMHWRKSKRKAKLIIISYGNIDDNDNRFQVGLRKWKFTLRSIYMLRTVWGISCVEDNSYASKNFT